MNSNAPFFKFFFTYLERYRTPFFGWGYPILLTKATGVVHELHELTRIRKKKRFVDKEKQRPQKTAKAIRQIR
ncbi:MAG: hypothetical protein A2X11_09205 [Bacteroidetes bacterium GWE2_42_24]|nr:MAG: hypothetical protein A2X11_09205 [Bacteroidetes bacterium GWE2_42_24]OFY31205.1 MAG: hypothetical protein A2X09_14835 [Bacteroidetes bacterium GWF2_43_11]